MNCLLGIEAGTTTVKATLIDAEKGVRASASVACPVTCASGGRAEIDMERYWHACRTCLAAIATESPKAWKQVKALSIASQGVTFVPVDRQGHELRKAITLYDTRAGREARALVARFGEADLYRITGQPKISAIYEAPKLMWLRRHEPGRFRKIHKILLVHDYLAYKLTGKFAAIPSLLSSSLLFDLKQKNWWPPMLDYLGLTPNQLPEIYKHGQSIGTVCRQAARATGLAPTTVVVAGALDQICGMTGVGNIVPGIISESTGTVLAVHTLAAKFFACKDDGILNFCHLRSGQYAWIGVCPTACSALDWFVDVLAGADKTQTPQTKTAQLAQLSRKASGIPPGSEGLILLPHLAGSGSPRPNPSARGVLYGMQLHHRREHLFRALLEAIACELRGNIEVFRRNGMALREIRSFGGGSRNRLWNQIKADICGLPVVTSKYPEPGCLGAALLAGVGVGLYKNAEEGVRLLVELNRPQYPDAAAARRYESFYRAYKHFERNMAPMYNRAAPV